MANCPKCNEHLKLTDWKQNCPHCGANIVVYDIQERLMKEADKAEVEYYHFQKKIDRVKASFIGTKLAIARIFTSLLPAGPIFLPLITAKFAEPFEVYEGKITMLEIVNKISGLTAGVPGMLKSESRSAGIFFTAAVLCFLLSLVCTVLHFLLNTLSCSPKGKRRNMIMDVLILVFTVLSPVFFLMMPDNRFVTGKPGVGLWLYIALQIVNVAVDHLTMRKGIPVVHKQCYVGGIPIEEYFEMQEKGMTTAEIRVIQYQRLQAIQDEKDRKAAEEKAKAEAEAEAEKRAKEEEDG